MTDSFNHHEGFSSRSVEETLTLGETLAHELNPGSIIALVGDLGAGKTHLSKGIVRGLGSEAEVSSPTFTLVHEYLEGRIPVAHFDWYRMEHRDEVIAMGWEEYLDEFPGALVVEWADKFPELLPENTQWWELTRDTKDQDQRLLQRIESPSPKSEEP